MDNKAIEIVTNYIVEHFDESNKGMIPDVDFTVYIVWKCKILQHWKYLISTSLPDYMYYELIYDGDVDDLYLDVYKRVDSKIISIPE